MPLNLKPVDVAPELEDAESVLIVSCPICPPMSLAMEKDSPFVQFPRHGIKTPAFEDYIRSIREPLASRGVRTAVHTSYLPLPTMCVWSKGQRRRLLRRARGFDAVLVLGCDSAAMTAEKTLEGTGCRVILAMATKGVANATMKIRFPLQIEFQAKQYIPVTQEPAARASRQ